MAGAHSAVLLGLMFLAVGATAQKCIVTTTLQEAQTELSVGGTVSVTGLGDAPQTGTIEPSADVTKGAGNIYVVLPTVGGKCPNADQLPAAIKQAYIANPTGKPGIRTIPANIVAKVTSPTLGELATVNVNGLVGTVSGSLINAATNLNGVFKVTASGGSAVIESIAGPFTQPLAQQEFTGEGCNLAINEGKDDVGIICNALSLSYPLTRDIPAADSPLGTALTIKADIVLEGKLIAAGKASAGEVVANNAAPANPNLKRAVAAAAVAPAGGRKLKL